MPNVNVSERSFKVVKRYLESHRPGKTVKPLEVVTIGEAADKLIDYADRRFAALNKDNVRREKGLKPGGAKKVKAKAVKVKAAAPKKAAKAKAKPKTGLSKKLARSAKKPSERNGVPKLKGNRKRAAAPAASPAQPSEPTPKQPEPVEDDGMAGDPEESKEEAAAAGTDE